jgi:hypothetical protein
VTNTGIERRGAAALAALFAVAVPQRVRGDEGGRPTLRVGALPDALQLDGILDEPAWAQAPSIEDLVMVEPGQGQRPTGRTLVKVLASPKALVFGARCEDPDAARIVSFTKERDGDFEAEDHLVIVLDPFQDGRSGYVFAVNPGGARFDGLVQPSGESLDTDWDGEWEAATHRDAAGWSAEIRVPIDTLSFKHGLKEWAFNIQRRLQRLQETDRWASARQDYKFYRTSQAGLLTGLPEFDTGVGLGIRPALVGGFQNPAPGAATDGTLDPSLDVTQRLGSNVLASLTVNTDFAETEVDTGLEVTALHNHFFWDSPKVMFMHIGGMGDEEKLAAAVGKVFAKIRKPALAKEKYLRLILIRPRPLWIPKILKASWA